MTVVLDYGMGNLASVCRAIRHLGHDAVVRDRVGDAARLILPGVGAFGAAMERLAPVADEIREYAASGRPLLGICLGQQLLFEESEELGHFEGLGLIGGRVRYFDPDLGLKVPHMGWNEVSFAERVREPGNLGFGLETGDQVYFVHSLYTECTDPADVAAWTDYGVRFAAAVQRGNVWGTQFHPEKSGPVGLKVLANFLTC